MFTLPMNYTIILSYIYIGFIKTIKWLYLKYRVTRRPETTGHGATYTNTTAARSSTDQTLVPGIRYSPTVTSSYPVANLDGNKRVDLCFRSNRAIFQHITHLSRAENIASIRVCASLKEERTFGSLMSPSRLSKLGLFSSFTFRPPYLLSVRPDT